MNSLLKRTTGDDAGPKLDINRYKGEGKLEEIQNSWEATERAGGRLPRVASCLHLPKRMGPNRHPFGRPTSRSDRTESTVLLAALWPNELVPAYLYHIGAGKPQSAPVAAFLAAPVRNHLFGSRDANRVNPELRRAVRQLQPRAVSLT